MHVFFIDGIGGSTIKLKLFTVYSQQWVRGKKLNPFQKSSLNGQSCRAVSLKPQVFYVNLSYAGTI